MRLSNLAYGSQCQKRCNRQQGADKDDGSNLLGWGFKRSGLVTCISFVGALLVLGMSGSAFAAPGGNPGKPGDGSTTDFGDLIKLYRSDDGVPYLTADGCWQPLPTESCTDACTLVDGLPSGVDVIPVDPATCGVVAECAVCTQEADFGRINEARSPNSVFESQLEDVVINLATADCTSLDPAGRLVTSTVVDETTTLTGAIDSPLQNLAMYRELMLKGTLGAPFPGDDQVLTRAARALGAASDKSGEVDVDLVAYLNMIIGLTDPATSTILGKICQDRKQEVAGVVQFVEECFLDYSAFGYTRADNFSTDEESLPGPSYIPDDTHHGWFEYLSEVVGSDPVYFEITQGPILDAVFCTEGDVVYGTCTGTVDSGFTEGDIGGFAQASEDTRAVIDFMHVWQVPEEYETPVICDVDPNGNIGYDIVISEESGLQVPTRIVDGSEGREFTVSVANNGPDAASGTVTVTAIAANGGTIEGSPWTFDFTDLGQGYTFSQTVFFSIDLGERTTINWEAIASVPYDVNPGNNSVTETSSVMVTGGGGSP